jgi:FKBP-type peptidyl-prolyl cis-trans isomerase FkpA
MKRLSIGLLALALAACGNKGGGTGAAPATSNAPLETEDQKTLYALGLALARNTQAFGLSPTDAQFVTRGFNDAISGAKPEVELETYGPKIQQFAQARMKARAEVEKQKGQATLDAAAAEPGAQKLPSGMVIKSISPGTGASPTATDTVKVNYEGKTADGKVFDSSYKRNQPATFPLRGVVPCWTEGLQKMKVGEKAQLTCPSSLAYGDMGHGPDIPGGATLIFTVELLEVMPPAAPGMPGAIPGLPGATTGGGAHPPMPGHPGAMPPPGAPAVHPGVPPPGAHPAGPQPVPGKPAPAPAGTKPGTPAPPPGSKPGAPVHH